MHKICISVFDVIFLIGVSTDLGKTFILLKLQVVF